MNKVVLCGNLTKDLDVKIIKGKTRKDNDTIVGRFTVAVNEGYGENKKTTFIPVTIFNKTVENLEKYLIKGTQVNIVGKLDIQSNKDDDGNFKTYVSVIAQEVQLLKVPEEDKKNYRR